MTHPASGNTPWQDHPSTATLITAGRLEAIEAALDGTVDKPFARYYSGAATAYTFSTARQRIPFAVEQDAHAAVVPNGARSAFTLNRAGVWRIETGVRLSAVSSSQTRYLNIGNDADLSLGGWAEIQEFRASSGCALSVSTSRRIAFGTTVSATLLVTGSGTATIATDIPEVTFISFTWERP